MRPVAVGSQDQLPLRVETAPLLEQERQVGFVRARQGLRGLVLQLLVF